MPYTAEISRNNPSCFLFLIDQSASMNEPLGGSHGEIKKDRAVADAINRLLMVLTIKCSKDRETRDFYHVGVIGYGRQVGPAFSGELSGQQLVPISKIGAKPARVEQRMKKVSDGAGGLVEKKIKFPIWFEPVSNGGTPMCEAFRLAKNILENWLNEHPNCFPPIVINITDGESTDGDPTDLAEEIKQLSSSDGSVLLFNLHLSTQDAQPVKFPDKEPQLPDPYANMLYHMSSVLPDYLRVAAKEEGIPTSQESRGFVFNAEIESVIQFLDIGTRPSNLR